MRLGVVDVRAIAKCDVHLLASERTSIAAATAHSEDFPRQPTVANLMAGYI